MNDQRTFYDERINAECGEIFKNALVICTVYSLLATVYKIFFLVTAYIDYSLLAIFGISLVEIATTLIGGGLLVLGLIVTRTRDERELGMRRGYFRVAGVLYVILTLSVYILYSSFAPHFVGDEYSASPLITMLASLAIMYIYCAFRVRGININYDFISERGTRYYMTVMRRIGMLCAYLAIPFAASGVAVLIYTRSFASVLATLFSYIGSALSVGIVYFLLSLVEKLRFDYRGRRLDPGSAILYIGMAGAVIFVLTVSLIGTRYLLLEPTAIQNYGKGLATLTLWRTYAIYMLRLFICLVIASLALGSDVTGRLASLWVALTVAENYLAMLKNILFNVLIFIADELSLSQETFIEIMNVRSYISGAISLLIAVGFLALLVLIAVKRLGAPIYAALLLPLPYAVVKLVYYHFDAKLIQSHTLLPDPLVWAATAAIAAVLLIIYLPRRAANNAENSEDLAE